MVIDGASNAVIATIPVGKAPFGVAVNPTSDRVYVANHEDDTVSVIDRASNAVIATIPAGDGPADVGVNPINDRIYVSNHGHVQGAVTLDVINGATHTVIATVPVGSAPGNIWVGVNRSTDRVYVSVAEDGAVYVIADALATPTP